MRAELGPCGEGAPGKRSPGRIRASARVNETADVAESILGDTSISGDYVFFAMAFSS